LGYSPGFFWFFNFVMKLEFNPKVVSSDGVDAVYLLDEPGSYLHASAQAKLCKKLKELSKDNYVIYCTHSHYLLDPEIIPISSIKISDKSEDFNINLVSIYDYDTGKTKKNAFQPIYDALQIKPFSLDISGEAVLVEGIYDYYCFSMFIGDNYHFVPSQNAESILYYISLMIGWHIKFNAIWDNDPEGRKYHRRAIDKFGNDLSNKLLLLPLRGRQKNCILQDFIESNDIQTIKKELGIPKNSNFRKTIVTLFYSDRKKEIIKKLIKTKENFSRIKSLFSF